MNGAYIGLFVCFLCLFLSSNQKANRLKTENRRLKRKLNNNGGSEMSRLLNKKKKKRCKLTFDEDLLGALTPSTICTILECDDEWLKIQYKKNAKKPDCPITTKIIRVDALMSIEPAE